MGMSSSQGRLLSITARLTSNEYESQQISNAKMRLATQSQEASSEYIKALNTTQLMYTTYDAKGEATSARLTAGSLYQYTDLKNQYSLVNVTGQVLLPHDDISKFEAADNLDQFLESYGLTKQWKSSTLKDNYELLQSPEYVGYKNDWDAAIEDAKKATYKVTGKDDEGNDVSYEDITSDRAWEIERSYADDVFMNALAKYDELKSKQDNGLDVKDQLNEASRNLAAAKLSYVSCVTYDNWLSDKASYNEDGSYTDEYLNKAKYDNILAEFNAEAEDFGPHIEDLYVYDDASKAQWYTNLWYRLNGESSVKSLDGRNGANYNVLDSKLMNSTTWIQDALTQGAITIEVASNKEVPNIITDPTTPTIVNLKGISWTPKIFSACNDITRKDDDQAIARAEAEYTRKTEEINAKDEKYQNKIKMLDTEHTALQTEYESVQSAMNKNIERSFKAFS
ncbi:hypothetical protein HDR58_09080 [bacterium]|nr:hypothetical protein [bacterium]